MECDFHVGQEVICIDNKIHFEWYTGMMGQIYTGIDLDGLQEGEKYTIIWIGLWQGPFLEPHVCVRLQEIRRQVWTGNEEAPYSARRFRPLIKKETDISIFNKMLVPTKKVLEDA